MEMKLPAILLRLTVVLYYTLSLGVRSRDPLIAYGKL